MNKSRQFPQGNPERRRYPLETLIKNPPQKVLWGQPTVLDQGTCPSSVGFAMSAWAFRNE